MNVGKGDKKNASSYNNSIHEPILDIPLDRVTPPYLHCLLGITKRHHTLLEDAADEIDRMVFTDDATKTEQIEEFLQYGGNYLTVTDMKKKLNFTRTCQTVSYNSDEEKKWKLKADRIDKEIDSFGKTDLIKRGGPICSTLDAILNKNNIAPQAYHGRSFIGNHSHKYFKTDIHLQLTKHLFYETTKCTNNQNIIDKAFILKTKLECINAAFSRVHKLVSHCDPIHSSDIPQIQLAVDHYMAVYRRHFPDKILPKHHVLEHHCIPFIQRYRFGLGLLGEQGGELLHSTIGKIQKRTQAMKDEACQLQSTMKSHLLQTSKHLQSLIPHKKRKTNLSEKH